MSTKSWYFLGFASLTAWIFFLSQPLGNDGRLTGFVLLLDSSRWTSDNRLTQTQLSQVTLVTVILLVISVAAFLKARASDKRQD